MGWDVVQIGLRHDLPIEDPTAMAKEIAKRMNQNVKLVFTNEYHFDESKMTISYTGNYDYHTLEEFIVNNSDSFINLVIANYQAKMICKKVGKDNLDQLRFANDLAKCLLNALEDEETYELYEIVQGDELSIRIYRENVELDVYVMERWGTMWQRAFEEFEDSYYRNWLLNYRKQIFDRAKLFGCNEVIICPDQGPAMNIYEYIYAGAEELLEYTSSRSYVSEDNWWLENEQDKKEWLQYGKMIYFPEVIAGKLTFKHGDFVDVILDDFKDMVN